MTIIRIKSQASYMAKLTSAILGSSPGDTIIVNSETQKELALRAIARICPERDVEIIVEPVGNLGGRIAEMEHLNE